MHWHDLHQANNTQRGCKQKAYEFGRLGMMRDVLKSGYDTMLAIAIE